MENFESDGQKSNKFSSWETQAKWALKAKHGAEKKDLVKKLFLWKWKITVWLIQIQELGFETSFDENFASNVTNRRSILFPYEC